MARYARFAERKLSKRELRKLNTLRKTLGEAIGRRAFGRWLSGEEDETIAAPDRNAAKIAELLSAMANRGELQFPRGGYVLRRGRGRVIVERPAAE